MVTPATPPQGRCLLDAKIKKTYPATPKTNYSEHKLLHPGGILLLFAAFHLRLFSDNALAHTMHLPIQARVFLCCFGLAADYGSEDMWSGWLRMGFHLAN